MEITYKNSYKDLFVFNFLHNIKNPLSIFFMSIIFTGLSWPIISMLVEDGFTTKDLFVLLIIESFIILALLLFWLIIILLTVSAKKNKNVMATRTIKFEDAGISMSHEYGNSNFTWEMIQKFNQSRKYFFIYTSQHAAYVIPKRIFDTKENSENFRTYLNEKLKR